MRTRVCRPRSMAAPRTIGARSLQLPMWPAKWVWPQRLVWFRYRWEGNYKRFYHSADGVNWIKWAEDSMTSYNGPNQLGIFIDPTNNAQTVSMTLVHWEED